MKNANGLMHRITLLLCLPVLLCALLSMSTVAAAEGIDPEDYDGLVILEDFAAEGFPDSGKGLAAGGGQASADFIRVNDGCAEFAQHFRKGGFTAGDAAGEGDDLHGKASLKGRGLQGDAPVFAGECPQAQSPAPGGV